jgi:4-hydroxythreonine-4-phosphate dehydrogenase
MIKAVNMGQNWSIFSSGRTVMLIITGGDIFGTNIESIVKVLSSVAKVPTVVCTSRWHFDDQCKKMGLEIPSFKSIENFSDINSCENYFLDLKIPSHLQIPADHLSFLGRGEIALAALEMCKNINFDQSKKTAVLTGPIDKAACVEAGFSFGGQTEYFESIWDSPACMILAGPKLRVGLATNHLALKDVPSAITKNGIVNKLKLLKQALRNQWGIEQPNIAVCALNPHAGDGRLFGDEDEDIIVPAVEEANRLGIKTSGPIPADTAFYQCYQGAYDATLAMYHDQGLGPLKLVHFDTAVNVSGGLPHLRVSPDHGPVKDLYLKQTASIKSWQTAYDLTLEYLSEERT